MANVNAPFGLRPVKDITGAAWTQNATMYYIPSTDTNAYYIGDAVSSAAGGDTITGASAVQLALNTNRSTNYTSGNLRGVIVGIGTAISTPGGNIPGAFDPTNLANMSIPATKAVGYYVWVVDDPNIIFEIQCDAGTVAAANMNKCAGFLPTAPTGIVVQSAGVLATASINTTNTLPLKIVGAPWRPDNDLTANYATVYVKINNHEFGNGVAGV